MILFEQYPDFDTAWAATEFRVLMGGMGDDTAMLIAEMYKRGYEPDEIVFSDTGSEFDHTYEFIEYLKQWCELMQWSKVVVIKKYDVNGDPLSVIGNCEKNNTLPAAAFGLKTCSHRFKIETADKYFNNHPQAWKAWGVKGKGRPLDSHTGSILRVVGYNADEPERAEKWQPEDKWVQVFPLIEWDIGEYESDVESVGLYYPGKSSCICCPHLTGGELVMLQEKYPDQFIRVQQIEANYLANKEDPNIGPKGLCRKDTIESKMRKFRERGATYDEATTNKCNTCKG